MCSPSDVTVSKLDGPSSLRRFSGKHHKKKLVRVGSTATAMAAAYQPSGKRKSLQSLNSRPVFSPEQRAQRVAGIADGRVLVRRLLGVSARRLARRAAAVDHTTSSAPPPALVDSRSATARKDRRQADERHLAHATRPILRPVTASRRTLFAVAHQLHPGITTASTSVAADTAVRSSSIDPSFRTCSRVRAVSLTTSRPKGREQ